MKYVKGSAYAAIVLVAAMYGWHLMATAINQHADHTATLVIQDVMSSNLAADIQRLREIRSLLEADEVGRASSLIDESIDAKLRILAHCISDKCAEMRSTFDAGVNSRESSTKN